MLLITEGLSEPQGATVKKKILSGQSGHEESRRGYENFKLSMGSS